MRILNRYLGGYRSVMRGLERLVGAGKLSRFSLLDVGTGSGDIPARITSWAQQRGIKASIVGLESEPVTARVAAILTQKQTNPPFIPVWQRLASAVIPAEAGIQREKEGHFRRCGISVVRGDGNAPPFHAGSFDFVLASQMLHHFSEEKIVAQLRTWSSLARKSDHCQRSGAPSHGLLRHPPRSRSYSLASHDFDRRPLSVKSAFTMAEWHELFPPGGVGPFQLFSVFPYRLLALISVQVMMKHFDVAIIGAGPAGSSAAIQLAAKGYSVALLDKEQFPREKLCGDFLNPVNWPMLRELKVERAVLARPHEKISIFRFTSFSGEEAEIPLPAYRDEAVVGLGLRRFDLDYVLFERAKSLGVTVMDGWKPKELERQPGGWMLKADKPDAFGELGARMLIGADGRNSWVAHHLGLADPAAMQGRSVGFQFRLKCANRSTGKVEIHLFPGGYAGIVGLDGDTVTLGLAIEKRRLPDGRRSSLAGVYSAAKSRGSKRFCRSQLRERNALDLSGLFFAPARLWRWGFARGRCRPCQRARDWRRDLFRAEKRRPCCKDRGRRISNERFLCSPFTFLRAGLPVGLPRPSGNQRAYSLADLPSRLALPADPLLGKRRGCSNPISSHDLRTCSCWIITSSLSPRGKG